MNIEIGRVAGNRGTKKNVGFSIVWIIPIVAALIGGWLTLQNHLRKRSYYYHNIRRWGRAGGR